MPFGSRVRLSAVALTFLAVSFGGSWFANSAREAAPHQASDRQVAALDFETFRVRVEPIFLKQRENGPRCYDCHSTLNTRLRLEPLSSGNSSWTEEESRKNFEVVLQLTTPGDPLKSRLLLHPLAPEAGGDPIHTGGKFWKSQGDPEWQMLA
ncbi:MAG TPA: hypothetical protein VNO32_11260, partial [Candidatus Acidoferrum sp.]|nr:hypothetical protein [Candidatus Acidoferrum sp.]